MRIARLLALPIAAGLLSAAAVASDEQHVDRAQERSKDARPHRVGDGEQEHHDDHDEHGVFSIADFERYGVVLETARSGNVDVEVELPGEVRPNADRIAHLAPRFSGLVSQVYKVVGDEVRKGEALARIESDNLSVYTLRAGFDGVVIDKHVAPGESVSPSHDAFVIADLSSVWVQVGVYQKALPLVSIGQEVSIETSDGAVRAQGEISYLAPVVDQATRTASARVVLENSDGRWRPGMFVMAHVAVPSPAEVIVSRSALHTFEGRQVVFVVEGETFVPRPVVVGDIGRRTAAISSGVSAGERYAAQGSFLVKADLAKGEGGHAH